MLSQDGSASTSTWFLTARRLLMPPRSSRPCCKPESNIDISAVLHCTVFCCAAVLLQAGEQYRPALDTIDRTGSAFARLEICSLIIAEVIIGGFQRWLFEDFRVDYLMITEVIIWGSKGWLCRLIRIVANRKISQSKGSAAKSKQKDNDRGRIANSRKLK